MRENLVAVKEQGSLSTDTFVYFVPDTSARRRRPNFCLPSLRIRPVDVVKISDLLRLRAMA
jgi:hypothetical protein